jgi:hypothetical protein
MNSRTKYSFFSLTIVVPALILGTGLSSAVAAEESVTEILVSSALAELQIEVTDGNLLTQLEETIDLALDEQVIDPAILEEIEQGLLEEAEPSEEPTSAPEVSPELGDLIEENLDEQTNLWEETAPAWLVAFEGLRAGFELCRTDGQSTSECARNLAFGLQLAHSEAKLAEIDAALAAIFSLPEEEQATELAELEAQRAAFQAKLERTAVRLTEAAAAGRAGATSEIQERLNTVIGDVQGRTNASTAPGQTQKSQEPTVPGAELPLNKNAPVTSPQEPAPQGGSVDEVQAPGNSGDSGRPDNPGSHGQTKRNNR